MNEDNEIRLGDEVVDTITGLKGVVVGICEYLHGSVQYQVKPEAVHDGANVKTEWLYRARITKG